MMINAKTNATFQCGRCQGRGELLVGRRTPLAHMETCPSCKGHGHIVPTRRDRPVRMRRAAG